MCSHRPILRSFRYLESRLLPLCRYFHFTNRETAVLSTSTTSLNFSQKRPLMQHLCCSCLALIVSPLPISWPLPLCHHLHYLTHVLSLSLLLPSAPSQSQWTAMPSWQHPICLEVRQVLPVNILNHSLKSCCYFSDSIGPTVLLSGVTPTQVPRSQLRNLTMWHEPKCSNRCDIIGNRQNLCDLRHQPTKKGALKQQVK